MEEEKNIIIQTELKKLKVLHAAILTGCIVFLSVTFYLIKTTGRILNNDKNEVYQALWLISILLLGLLPLAYFLFKRKIDKLTPEKDIDEKLAIFRTAFFLKLALIDAAYIINTVFLLLTNNKNILLQVMMILIIMFLNFPYRSQMMKDLKMEDGERS